MSEALQGEASLELLLRSLNQCFQPGLGPVYSNLQLALWQSGNLLLHQLLGVGPDWISSPIL